VTHVIGVASDDLHASISRLFPQGIAEAADEQAAEEPVGGVEIGAKREGYVQAVDETTLLSAASNGGAQLNLLRRPGDYVIRGMPLAIASPGLEDDQANRVRSAFILGAIRQPEQDAVFAFLQVAEIAVRALSPGINDPFTAIMCIDRITSAMKQLGERSLPPAVRRDNSGSIRIVARPYDYEDLVEAGYRHIRESAKGHWQVLRHLRMQIEYVAGHVRDARFRAALRKETAALS
jgi:uncharacterized membrane protein